MICRESAERSYSAAQHDMQQTIKGQVSDEKHWSKATDDGRMYGYYRWIVKEMDVVERTDVEMWKALQFLPLFNGCSNMKSFHLYPYWTNASNVKNLHLYLYTVMSFTSLISVCIIVDFIHSVYFPRSLRLYPWCSPLWQPWRRNEPSFRSGCENCWRASRISYSHDLL